MPWTMNTAKHGEYQQERDWAFAYSSTPPEACSTYDIVDVEGTIPADLKGTFYKVGPGNFERNGKSFEHVLDGDGFVMAIHLKEGKAKYQGRFVETEYFLEEQETDSIRYRNVFGTQRSGGPLANAFDLTLKNVANTNIVKWGDRLFVFWEAGRPYELDPETLETLCPIDEDGPFEGLGGLDCKVRGITIDEGGAIDQLVNVGRSFTAHPHVWDDDTFVAFKSETNAQTKNLELEFVEYDGQWREKSSIKHQIFDSPPPHDFTISTNHYAFFENPYGEMDNTAYLLGFKAPTQIMQLALRQNTLLHVVARSKKGKTMQVEVPASYFNIHTVGISEETEDGLLTVYSTGWDLTDERFFPQSKDSAPFLGAWGGAYPDFVGGIVPPSLLYRTVVDLNTGKVTAHEEVTPGITVEFPTQEEDSPEYLYCIIGSTDYTSLPGTGVVRTHAPTGKIETWWTEPGIFSHEVLPIQKDNGDDGYWLLTPLYDAKNQRTSLAILDSNDFSSGPVCRIHLKHHVTYGLHSSFAPS